MGVSITDQSLVQKALRKLRRHGPRATLHLACIRLVNLVLPFKILRGMYASRVEPALLACPYRPTFLPAKALADLQHYLSKGYDGMLSHVESTNFDSLKSAARMGAEMFGSICVVRIFGRHFAFSSPGCRRFDFRIEDAAAPARGLRRGKA
jgi:hypothetical protein